MTIDLQDYCLWHRRTKDESDILPSVAGPQVCKVRARGNAFVHEVEVCASSAYEAAAMAYRELRKAVWSSRVAQEAVILEVVIQQPEVIHRISLERLKAYGNSAGPPNQMAKRLRVRELMHFPTGHARPVARSGDTILA